MWAHRAHTYQKQLNRVHRVAMMALGAFARSTPMLGLEILYDYMPLDLRVEMEAIKAANRIKNRNVERWDSIGNGQRRGHLYYYRDCYEDLDEMTPVFQWNGLPAAIIEDGRPIETKGICCYTDGSKQEDSPVGYGLLIHEGEETYEEYGQIGTQATVYQGEVFAVDRAVTRILESQSNDEVDIFIDNRATIISLSKPECKSKTAYNCRLKLI